MPEQWSKKEKQICLRFGSLAVGADYITTDQLLHALEIQVRDDLAGEPHRPLGRILFDLDIMTVEQIDAVLRELFGRRSSADEEA